MTLVDTSVKLTLKLSSLIVFVCKNNFRKQDFKIGIDFYSPAQSGAPTFKVDYIYIFEENFAVAFLE